MQKRNKKCLNEVAKFSQQIRQGPYFICIRCHRCLHKRSVRLFEHEKYCLVNTIKSELYCLVRSIDGKIYISNICHYHLSRNKMLFQAVFDRKSLDPIPDELIDFKKIEKIFIYTRIIFKKTKIMHGKGES